MQKKRLKAWLSLLSAGVALSAVAQVEVDYTKYPDYSPVLRTDPSLSVHPVAQKKARGLKANVLPERVNNAETIYFPPVFNQAGGSCGSASRISYMFNYEVNALHGRDGSKTENQYPSHFTWLLTNQSSGKEGMAEAIGVPNVPTYGGRTYSALFGNQTNETVDYGWMTGYDKWYAAMQNRLAYNISFPYALNTEQGREDLKWWLYNHNGDTDFKAGGIAGIGLASGGTWVNIPSTPTNDAIGVTGMKYVKAWGPTYDHALTIVGYDDRIEFDLDGNGVYGEKDKDEVGAWIIVNSWGASWCNKGFIYCPYKNAVTTATSNSYWKPDTYRIRKNYRPLRVLKILMEYNHRARMRLSAGVSQNLNATTPEKTILFEHFKYAGNGDVPMLGRWADGKLHEEPMEFGYDLTDLTNNFDRTKPLKYFFIIETKATDTLGHGKVHELSLMDYEYDKNGMEIPFTSVTKDGVDVPGFGKKTVISMIVNGESLNAPVNLAYADGSLSWDSPSRGSGEVKGYNVYHNGVKLNATALTGTSYNVGSNPTGQYQVSAVYDFSGDEVESGKSNTALLPVAASISTSKSLRFSNGGFAIPNVFKNHYDEATLEFQLRPIALTNSHQIGVEWGKFLFQTASSGALSAGWVNATNGKATTSASVLKASTWTNVALVIRGGSLTIYANGKEVGSVVSTVGSGIGGFDTLYVGVPGSNTGINGYVDEVRFWNKARTPEQLKKYATSEFANPTSQDGLIAYYKMDRDTVDGVVYVKDAIAGNDAPVWGKVYNGTVTPVKTAELKADFTLPTGNYYALSPIALTDASSTNVAAWKWEVEDAESGNLNIPNPVVTFKSAGEKTVKLTVTGVDGTTATAEKTLTVGQAALPVSKFHATRTTAPAGERISFVNDSLQSDCSYEWLMPGANTESAHSTNALAIYNNVGSYKVTLRVTNAAGTVESSQDIQVEAVAPEADFEVSPRVIIKGEKTYLKDLSKYQPTDWVWTLKSPTHAMVVLGQNTSLTPTTPGIYDVQLKASNVMGSNAKTSTGALVVCNADSKNGLHFDGGSQNVSLTGPFSSGTATKFTVEYWLRPMELTSSCNYIGSSESTFQMTTNASGAMTVTVKGKQFVSSTGYVVKGAWHHYAVVFSLGTVTFYRDGVQISKVSTTGASYSPKWENGLRIGGTDGPLTGMIDEFRVWGTALTVAKIKTYSNAPIEDVSVVSADKLLVYYNFNQASGNCTDASGNNYTGVRNNFGPDGDAWNSSEGVFCLDFTSEAAKDVTASYLKNYKAQFAHNNVNVIQGGSGKYELTDWKISGAVTSASGTITSKPHVNTSKNSAMTMESGWSSFPSVTNCAAYQTIELPAGSYLLTIAEQEKITSGSYLVVASGDTIPNVENLDDDALAYSAITDKTLSFVLPEVSTVSLGVLFRMSGQSSTSIKSFKLERSDVELFTADNVDAIHTAKADGKLKVTVERGGISVSGDKNQLVTVYSIDGVVLFSKRITSTERINLAKGVYIVNGEKVLVN